MVNDEEDRILRVWTPVILRTVLIVSVGLLVLGMLMMMAESPSYYATRFHQVQSRGSSLRLPLSLSQLARGVSHGNPHEIMTVGLIVLTLVPLGRVAFTFLLFLKERDTVFVVATAYVLAGLVTGMLLGRIG